ncbi:TerB family tellurite resistance protein [Chryseolinea sp. H1M3-3]|uniref:TerB family tellurite resistance protein n=1 Tax=Chryseolinea sp. H1M3-3 TaxID=3034144 RepID=UPI0023EAD4D1|nr:TerB family tellurite resistance protein [Chryseolinea sp. H1M3-3]
MEVKSETLLTGYSQHEKAAYLGALAALATADREANADELEHLREISHAAGISPEEEQNIIEAAKDTSGQNLKQCLDALKESNLRYGLITDLMALAKADQSYTEEEKGNIEKVAKYLNVTQTQFSVLDQLVNKAGDEPHNAEELAKPDFLQSSGMQQKLSNAGIDLGAMGKGIFGFLGPMLLGGLAGKMLGGGRKGAGGLAGGVLGGMLGGNAGGGISLPGGMGGLGSLISGLSKSRSNQSMGGLLGKLFK